MVEKSCAMSRRRTLRGGIALLRLFQSGRVHHASGILGEDPNGIPNNLMPFITQVAVGKRPELSVFGNDYATPDGTGVRDYIHVVDLARGHLAALGALTRQPGVLTVNLAPAAAICVLEVIAAFERASGRKVPYCVVARRPGDIAVVLCRSGVGAQPAGLGGRARPRRDVPRFVAPAGGRRTPATEFRGPPGASVAEVT